MEKSAKNKFLKSKRSKITLTIMLSIVLIPLFAFFATNEPLPTGKQGAEAEALAQKLLTTVNNKSWLETGAISWDFAGKRKLLWDRKRQLVKVSWKENVVFVNLQDKTGVALKKGKKLAEKEAAKLITKAWKIWVNDSFWLNPVSKIYDSGTTRSVVDLKNGKKGLLVSYSSGGATPGDSYLWEFGDNGLPIRWKMWVSVIPIGGTKATWENWTTLSTGAKIATKHKMPLFTLELSEIKAGKTLEEIAPKNAFEVLEK